MIESVIYYRGRPIEDLTREELIEALKVSVKETASVRSMHDRDMRMRDTFAELRSRVA